MNVSFDYSLEFRVFPRPLTHGEIIALYEGRIKPLRCRKCGHYYFTSRPELMHHIWERHRKCTVLQPNIIL